MTMFPDCTIEHMSKNVSGDKKVVVVARPYASAS